MNSSAILQYPIKPIAALPMDHHLATVLLASMSEYSDELHGRRIWLACSGGRDSLALAAICVQLYQEGRLPFLPQLLHVNHGLQVDSCIWAQHVADWAYAQQIPCEVLEVQVSGHDEQAARQARYQVMRSYINQEDVLMLAHHADDQAETVLMRLIQGAGVKGLSGMQPWRIQDQDSRRNVLWRPWLTVRRAHISHYAQSLELPYIDDPTNDNGDNVRSGLRRDIMPALAHYNHNVVDNIARSAQLLSAAHTTVSAQAALDMQDMEVSALCDAPAQRVLNIDKLKKLPVHRQSQLLHHWLSQDEPLPATKQLVDDVWALTQRTDPDHQTQLTWQGRNHGYSIRRYREQLYRLSAEWSKWLQLPIREQTHTLSELTVHLEHRLNVNEERSIKGNLLKSDLLDNSVSDHSITSLILRSHKEMAWQVDIMSDALKQLLQDYGDQTLLKVSPLGRQQRVQTKRATRPQAGKKLYQTLGIPTWLRDSLVVISVVLPYDTTAKAEWSTDIPIVLLSPFDSWVLDADSSLSYGSDTRFYELFSNDVTLNHRQ